MALVRFGEIGAAGEWFVAERMKLEDREGIWVRWNCGRENWGKRSCGWNERRG